MGTNDSVNKYHLKTTKQLEAVYGDPLDVAVNKQTNHISEPGKAFINAAPFLILATASENGVDCSPKGDKPGFVKLKDDRTLLVPDRKGNNRVDGMKHIISNPKVGVIFLIPGVDLTYRVNGMATISIEPDLLSLFLVNDKPPCSVICIKVETAFHHCTKALVRANLWHDGAVGAPVNAPNMASFAKIRAGNDSIDLEKYEAEYQARVKETLY
ncbi:MAG: MSMEG_1061 family FMN-dependent PPOX-type flavoprotein [Pseudomonadota bacterium]|nr:MSMEG_1061 family FMN-dependent PPOX-type flavoprotein [Pseudomonadota bacterium]